MKRLTCGLVLALILLPLSAQTVIIVQTTAGCATCTTDGATASGYPNGGTNDTCGQPTNQMCHLGKVTLAQSGCGGAAASEIYGRFRNSDAATQRMRFVVYTDDGGVGDASRPDVRKYYSGCFYSSVDNSAGGGEENRIANRTDQACTDDGSGETDGTFDFPCADAPDDIWWVGWCAEQTGVFHGQVKGTGAAADDIYICLDSSGVFDTPPATWSGGSYVNTKMHNMVVEW